MTSVASEMALPEHEVPVQRPGVAATASSKPDATEAPAVASTAPAATPVPAPAVQLVALAPLTIDIWNAQERYFSVSGSTPDEIVASAVANVPNDPSGAARSTMAYVGPITWDHRPSYVQDPSNGSCTMTAVASTAVYQATLPRWTAPTNVQPELLAWWRVVLAHIQKHESEHVVIFEAYVRELPGRVVGQPCSSWDAIIGQWSAEVVAAQAEFDAHESHWALPAYTGPLGG